MFHILTFYFFLSYFSKQTIYFSAKLFAVLVAALSSVCLIQPFVVCCRTLWSCRSPALTGKPEECSDKNSDITKTFKVVSARSISRRTVDSLLIQYPSILNGLDKIKLKERTDIYTTRTLWRSAPLVLVPVSPKVSHNPPC